MALVTAVHGNHIILCYNILYYIMLYYIELYHILVYYVQYNII